MPSVRKLTERGRDAELDAKHNRLIAGDIARGCSVLGIQLPKFANMAGMPESTMYYRVNHPDTFRVKEIRQINRILVRKCGLPPIPLEVFG